MHITEYTYTNSSNHSTSSDVLLIYVYADTHQHAYGNLKYFVETAVREKDGVDYIFILQQVHNKEINEKEMPPLPQGNAFYFQHENRCFDFGTIGWFIEKYTTGNPWKKLISPTKDSDHRKFNLTQYKYFIFMNSSVRGPFFPPYFLQFLTDYEQEFNQVFYWYYIFTKRINERVKLVGCTLSCTVPLHIQSYFLTTDFIGLSILLESGGIDGMPGSGVFTCHESQSRTIMFSELASSVRIFNAGYMVTSLLTIYHTLHFSKKHDYHCPVYGSPYKDKNLDGVSLEPYEVVFVKFNDRADTCDAQNRANLYQKWIEQAKIKNRTSW